MTKISSHGSDADQDARRCRRRLRGRGLHQSSTSVGWTFVWLADFPLKKDGRGDWIRTSDLHTPSVMRYQAALRPDLAGASRQAPSVKARCGGRRKWRGGGEKRKARQVGWARHRCAARASRRSICVAALIGSLVPVNRGWTEPAAGHHRSTSPTTASTPTSSCRSRRRGSTGAADPEQRLRRRRSRTRAGSPSARARSGSISTRRPGGTSRRARIWSALAGGKRVMHVEYVPSPAYAVREIRLRPEEYRRLWAAIRADFALDPQRPAAAHRPSGLRPVATLSTGATGKAKRGPHLQQLGRALAAARRGQDQPVAAVRAGAGVAVPESGYRSYSPRPLFRARSG